MARIFCEHCGDMETNTPQISDPESQVNWCVWCACAGDLITTEQLKEYIKLDQPKAKKRKR